MIVRHSRSVLLACTAFVTLGLTSISLKRVARFLIQVLESADL